MYKDVGREENPHAPNSVSLIEKGGENIVSKLCIKDGAAVNDLGRRRQTQWEKQMTAKVTAEWNTYFKVLQWMHLSAGKNSNCTKWTHVLFPGF